jgi:hypothetical protein
MGYFASDKPDGLFLHIGWRTGGTWLWSCFREQPGLMGFYEPLHESLANVTPARVQGINVAHWRKFGHPPQTRPYFEEYVPLIHPGRGGVKLFSPDFTFMDFFPADHQDNPALFAYLTQLREHARASGAKPVFKFTLSMGRIHWMKREFPSAAHVALIRNPISQFASSLLTFHETGNAYFLAMSFTVLAANIAQPGVSAAVDAFQVPLPRLDAPTPEAIILAAQAHVRSLSPEDRYRGFLAFWLLSASCIPDDVDLLIQNEIFSASAKDRANMARKIGKLIGTPPNLGIPKVPPNQTGDSPSDFGFPALKLCELHRLAMTRVNPNSRHARDINISLAGGIALALGKNQKRETSPWRNIAAPQS